jgi:hypothetical protein
MNQRDVDTPGKSCTGDKRVNSPLHFL